MYRTQVVFVVTRKKIWNKIIINRI